MFIASQYDCNVFKIFRTPTPQHQIPHSRLHGNDEIQTVATFER